MTKEFSPLPFFKTGTDSAGWVVFEVYMYKSCERGLGWMVVLIYISASLHLCLSSEEWSRDDHYSMLPSLTHTHMRTCILSVFMHLSCALSSVGMYKYKPCFQESL